MTHPSQQGHEPLPSYDTDPAFTTNHEELVKDLEKENARLKKLVAEKEQAIDILNEVARGEF